MLISLQTLLATLSSIFRSRAALGLENLTQTSALVLEIRYKAMA